MNGRDNQPPREPPAPQQTRDRMPTERNIPDHNPPDQIRFKDSEGRPFSFPVPYAIPKTPDDPRTREEILQLSLIHI
eukprot:12322883-Prorocentrum_lima.AAC.1